MFLRWIFGDPNATREEKLVAAHFEAQLSARFLHYRNVYVSRFKRTINVDNVKELSVIYAANRETRARYSQILYEPAKNFSRRLFEWEIASAGVDRVLFFSGGAGSGKSVLNHYGERQKKCLILDGTLSRLPEALSQIKLAISCSRSVEIIHVYCPLEKAVFAAVDRGIKLGRGMSLDSLASTHFFAQDTFLKLANRYLDSGESVKFAVLDNSDYHDPRFQNLDFLVTRRYKDLSSIHDVAFHAFESALIFHAGKQGMPVPNFIVRAFKKPGRKVA